MKNLKIIGTFLILMVSLLLIEGCSEVKKTSISSDFTKNTDLERPSWLGKEPVVMVGNWDAMPIFAKRRGGSPVWMEKTYKEGNSEEMVKKWKDMGITMAMIHFFKGYGLEAEKEHMEDSKKLAALCKKYGIRVGVYVGSTMCYETFLLEKPEASEWIVPDYLGKPVTYGSQTHRKRVYFPLEGYKNYIKKTLKIAINEMKVDLIHFDNTSNQATPAMFFHPAGIEDFKTYLKQKYTSEELKDRLGFSDVSYVEPPKYARSLRTINDPISQEWTDFRCFQLTNYYAEMEQYIRKLNPQVAVEANPHGLSGQNTQWDSSLDFPMLLAHTDFFWTEGEHTELKKDGTLISKIRTFKMAGTLKNRVFTYANTKLELAESMAYNRQVLGMVSGSDVEYKVTKDQQDYIKFYHKNFNSYRDIDNIADVAILHTYNTMAFNNGRPYQSTFLFEQSLIQERVPFDIIFDNQLKNLSKYKVLILADQECLSEEQLKLIEEFVRNGGGLVATGHTSLYTTDRRLKRDFGLKELFQLESSDEENGTIVHNLIDKGRVAYISEVKPVKTKSSTAAMTGKYWQLPVNSEDLINSVKWTLGTKFSVKIDAPNSVTMELTKDNEDENNLMLHLVNYNTEKVENIKVKIQVPEGKQVKGINLLSPDSDIDIILDHKIESSEVVFTVPQLDTYDLIILKLVD